MNAIFFPSGDQDGSWALIWLPVTRLRPLPSKPIVKIAHFPFDCCSANARRVPSGDQAGLVCASGSVVRRRSSPVTAFTAKSS